MENGSITFKWKPISATCWMLPRNNAKWSRARARNCVLCSTARHAHDSSARSHSCVLDCVPWEQLLEAFFLALIFPFIGFFARCAPFAAKISWKCRGSIVTAICRFTEKIGGGFLLPETENNHFGEGEDALFSIIWRMKKVRFIFFSFFPFGNKKMMLQWYIFDYCIFLLFLVHALTLECPF